MRVRLGVLVLVVALLLMACTSPHQLPEAPTPIPRLVPATLPPSGGESGPAVPAPAQPASGSTGGQLSGDGDAAHGQQVFESNCSVCHNLTDQQKVGPGLAGLVAKQSPLPNGQPFTEENLREWIHNGGGAMPGIPIGEAEMNDLIAFLGQQTQ